MLVETVGLGHRFGDQPQLFSNLTTTFQPGKTYALTGPSGSGKSTLLGIIAGWIKPSQGELKRTGITRISWVFQNPYGVAGRTALDHVCLPFIARGTGRAKAVEAATGLLATMRLEQVAHQPFRELSGGEGQRLMLARALASEPDLLLMDEPTAQLDAHTALEVVSVLDSLSARNCIVAIATHDLRVSSACDAIIELGNDQ